MLTNKKWPDWARYRAYDADGTICYFEEKPVLCKESEIWDTKTPVFDEPMRFKGEWERGCKYKLTKDWTKTLELRPKPWPKKGIYG